MNKRQKAVDQLLREVIGDGDISHLPGAGLPLRLDDDSATPDEWRMASKIMRDNDIVPSWIASAKALDERESQLREEINARAKRYLREAAAAARAGSARQSDRIEKRWRHSMSRCLRRIEKFNRDALAHNLTLPAGAPHKMILRGEELIERALGN